ncbi:MAG TPA: molybdenum cofactor biosynthesis protein MoaE [Actinomycetota bacterium]|nr:molybdenum cofactor biosynthesis protein MoaE [Actinomycetota bacterium]
MGDDPIAAKVSVEVTSDPIDVDQARLVGSSVSGALVAFAGRVRDATDDRPVSGLDYEAYSEMASKSLQQIADEALSLWEIEAIRIVHRVGQLAVGEVSVLVAVAAPHRGAAFDACEFCIDTLKERAPIWKKERFEDGESRWVSHP